MDFKLHQRQREFMENPSRFTFIPPRYPYGKRAMQEEMIRIEALDAHEADLALKDLRESGISLMSNGRRMEPRIPRNECRIEFDELPRKKPSEPNA